MEDWDGAFTDETEKGWEDSQELEKEDESEEAGEALEEDGENEKEETEGEPNVDIYDQVAEMAAESMTAEMDADILSTYMKGCHPYLQDPTYQKIAAAELWKLNKKFPECKIQTLSQLIEHEKGEEMLKLWSSGVPLATVYGAVNLDQVLGERMEAVRQSAVNSVRGRQGFLASPPAASQLLNVPGEVIRAYRTFFPDWSDSQIAEDYKKHR